MNTSFKLHVYDSAHQFLDSRPTGLDQPSTNIILGSARDALIQPQNATIWLVVSEQDATVEGAVTEVSRTDEILDNSVV